MAYPGNQELSAEARQRVLTAFHQVIAKLQAGRRDEALIGLEFVLRLDPSFTPACHLQEQLSAGGEVDLGDIVALLEGNTSAEIDMVLVDAVEDFNERRFDEAREKVLRVIGEMPGHQEARALLAQIDEAAKRGTQVESYLERARAALADGNPQGAAEFVMMGQALDPHHPGISRMLDELSQATPATGAAPPAAEPPAQSGPPAAAEAPPAPKAPPPAAPGPPAPAEPPAAAAPPPPAEPPPAAAEAPAASELGGDEGGFSFAFDEAPGGEAGGFGGFSVDSEPGAPTLDSSAGAPAWESQDDDAGDFTFGAGPAAPEGQPVDADVSDLFSDDGDVDSGAGAEVPGAADSQRLQELLNQGQELYESGQYQEAIDVLSRVFLIDPGHEGATQLIDEARARKDEIDRKAEHLLCEAEDAADAGNSAEALRLADEVLSLQPGHLEALALKDRLASAPPPAGPPPPPAAPQEKPPAEAGGAPPEPETVTASQTGDLLGAIEELPPPPPAAAPTTGRRLPWRIIALAAGGLLVLLVGVFFGSQLLSSGGDQSPTVGVDAVLRQAQELYQQGRAEEAVHLLQEYPASGLDQARVAKRLAEYQKALAPPTPTPIPSQLPAAEKALDAGRLLEAYTLVLSGLKQFPHDSGLVQLRERILQHEPLVASLVRASDAGDSATALSVTRELAERHPGDAEFQHELDRHLFNVAVQELRSYNLTGAAVHLEELARRRPQDDEVRRILDFIEKYKTRPADMQLKIFIASLSTR